MNNKPLFVTENLINHAINVEELSNKVNVFQSEWFLKFNLTIIWNQSYNTYLNLALSASGRRRKWCLLTVRKLPRKCRYFTRRQFAMKLSLYHLNPQGIFYILTLKVWRYHWDLTTTKYKRDYEKFSWGHECIHSHHRSDTNYMPKRWFQTNLDCESINLFRVTSSMHEELINKWRREIIYRSI